jgi:hypothetical protein
MTCVNRLVVQGQASGNRGDRKTENKGRRRLAKLAAMTLGAAAALACAPVAHAYDPPPSDFFPIGVFLQPTWTFDTWQSRGVNTVVDFDPNVQSLESWNAAAVSRGLYMIRAPRTDLSQDVNEHYLLAWSHHDEPDLNGASPSSLAAAYAAMKAADPNRPVYVNFSGGNVLNQNDAYPDSLYKTFSQSADWVAQDIYPVTGWGRPDWINYAQAPGDFRWNAGLANDKLRAITGGKKQFAYIETSNQQLSWVPNDAGPTAAQVRGETWDAIIHGAKGIVYFPQQIGNGFSFDATPADVAAEITKTDALITSLGAVLNSGSDATDNTVKLTSKGSVVADLEGTWRLYGGHEFLFVLNMSTDTLSNLSFTTDGLSGATPLTVFNEGRNLTTTAGAITDSFAPYQLHIYEGSSLGSPVPEPTGAGLLIGLAGSCLLARKRRA